MDFKLTENDQHPILHLSGRFDASVSFDFFAMASKAMLRFPNQDITVDLGGVSYVDSSAIGKLINFSQQLSEKGRRLIIVNCQPEVRKILDMMGIAKLMAVR